MMKNLRTIKASMVIGVLLVSIFVAFIPSCSAGFISASTANLMMEYDATATDEDIMPLAGPRVIPLTVKYMVTGVIAKSWIPWLSTMAIPMVELSVVESPEWCTAAIEPNVVSPSLAASEWQSAKANLLVSVNENAPARNEGKIRVKLHSKEIHGAVLKIPEAERTFDVTFTPGYLPTIGFTTKEEGNFMEVAPGETARFPIEIDNLGNARTEVVFNTLNIPKGWSPNIIASTVIGSDVHGETASKTVEFVVQPPYSFGYHNEREVLQFSMKPHYFADPSMQGQEYTLSFVVHNRGFSVPGFEVAFVAIALIGMAFVMNRKQNKD